MRDPRDFVDFDKSCHSLIEVAVEVFGKFIYVNFDENAESLDAFLHTVKHDVAMFQTENMDLVRKMNWIIDCNVKSPAGCISGNLSPEIHSPKP